MAASDYRAQIAAQSSYVTAEYGDELGWIQKDDEGKDVKFIVPEPIVEAVFDLESGGGNIAVEDSPSGAIGPMQIMPSGQEAYWWADLTGDSVPLDREDLKHPETAFRIATVGLGKRYEQITDIVPGAENDWYAAGAAYFGCIVRSDGTFSPACSDPLGTTGSGYYDTIKEYVHEHYDQNVIDFMDQGLWGQSGGGGFGLPDWGDVLPDIDVDVPGVISDVARDVINGVFSFLGNYVPRFGIAVLGLLFLGFGLRQVVK